MEILDVAAGWPADTMPHRADDRANLFLLKAVVVAGLYKSKGQAKDDSVFHALKGQALGVWAQSAERKTSMTERRRVEVLPYRERLTHRVQCRLREESLTINRLRGYACSFPSRNSLFEIAHVAAPGSEASPSQPGLDGLRRRRPASPPIAI